MGGFYDLMQFFFRIAKVIQLAQKIKNGCMNLYVKKNRRKRRLYDFCEKLV